MPNIPDRIGGVELEFASTVNREVTDEMLAALNACIASDAVSDETISKLWISSANDRHNCPSRHKTGNGVDISRVNEKKIGVHYTNDASVRKIVDRLQTYFENAPNRRENFGPTIQKKEGAEHPIGGHDDHFHWSVNGDHSACSTMWRRFFDFIRPERLFRDDDKPDEVCNI